MNTEIWIENYKLDLTKDIDASITYTIDDIKDFGARNTNYSKTIVIPGTQKNNKILGNIFRIDRETITNDGNPNVNDNYNIAKSAKCIIFQNQIQVFKGIFRILEIIVDNERIEYECSVFGELSGLLTNIGAKKLIDLDFSQYNHVYNISNISNSWDIKQTYQYNGLNLIFVDIHNLAILDNIYNQIEIGDIISITGTSHNNAAYNVENIYIDFDNRITYITVNQSFTDYGNFEETGNVRVTDKEGYGYYYPLIDYGNYSATDDKVNWDVLTFRPALYVFEILDLIIRSNKYNWFSKVFTENTNIYRKLIIPFNKKVLATLKSASFVASIDNTFNIDHFLSDFTYDLPIGTLTSPYNIFNLVDGYKITYGGSETINLKQSLIPNVYFAVLVYTPSTNTRNYSFQLRLKKNGTSFYSQNISFSLAGTNVYTNYDFTINFDFLPNIELNTSDYVSFEIFISGCDGISNNNCDIQRMRVATTDNAYSLNNITLPIGLDDTVFMQDCIPANILQKDFLSSLIKMFNLYLYEDKNQNTIRIEQYIDFYDKDLINFKDWSLKIDRSKPFQIKPLSELNARYYKFKFKNDSDYYNDLYNKRYNLSYGSYIFDTAYEFAKDDQSIDVIFSGTPMVQYSSGGKIYSTIFKRTGNYPTYTEEQVDSNIRILSAKLIVSAAYNITNDGSTILNTVRFPYAGHLDDPYNPTYDINFGVPSELFFKIDNPANLGTNLFSVFWLPYMYEIIDQNSRLLTATFRLNEIDIQLLDFSKPIYIDGCLYRLNKIVDYNLMNRDTCKVELLKIIELEY
jgi:hypothetical protein